MCCLIWSFFKLPMSYTSNSFLPLIRWSGEWGKCAYMCVCVYHMKFGDWWFSFLFIFHFWCRFMHLQYLPQILIPKRPIWDRFAVLFSVSIVWMYAQLLTSSGVYNNRPAKTQISCRTDRAGLFTAAPWWDFQTSSYKYYVTVFVPPSWNHINLPSYFHEAYLRLRLRFDNHS